mgnify:CR=1 FL=1|jgi:hypothetical protein
MVVYVSYDTVLRSYVAVTDDDVMIKLCAASLAEAEQLADVLDEQEMLYEE